VRVRGFEGWTAWIAVALLAVIILGSVLAPMLTAYDPNAVDMRRRLRDPGRSNFLGTDQMGRDLFTRVLYGGRVSIGLAILASLLSMLVGLMVGLAAGYFGGPVDSVILLMTNIVQGLPSLALMIALAAVMGPGIRSILVALVVTSWTGFSRVVRGEVLKIREEDYVEGIRSLGAGHLYVLVRHIVPNLAGTAVVILTVRISGAVLAIASLSFLGFGMQPPTPDWGVMVRDALNYFRSQPMLIVAPGAAVFLTSLSINMIGDALRDLLDVRLSSQRT
jgi:peptide/nickel transport system permease protein